jgi:hypothetical protein
MKGSTFIWRVVLQNYKSVEHAALLVHVTTITHYALRITHPNSAKQS